MKSSNPHSGCRSVKIAKTLDTSTQDPSKNQGGIAVVEKYVYDARDNGTGNVVPTITGDHNNRVTDYTCLAVAEQEIILERAFFNQGKNAKYDPICPPLVAKGPHAIQKQYIVRRITPTECARLQGFPSWWGIVNPVENLTDEDYAFWLDVRNTYAEINGKATKEYTREQMLAWYNKLHSDSAEYKMWGNGIALPNALYVMQGIAEVVGVHHSK